MDFPIQWTLDQFLAMIFLPLMAAEKRFYICYIGLPAWFNMSVYIHFKISSSSSSWHEIQVDY